MGHASRMQMAAAAEGQEYGPHIWCGQGAVFICVLAIPSCMTPCTRMLVSQPTGCRTDLLESCSIGVPGLGGNSTELPAGAFVLAWRGVADGVVCADYNSVNRRCAGCTRLAELLCAVRVGGHHSPVAWDQLWAEGT